MVSEVRASGYRSLRSIGFPLGRLSVFVGANGAGKTNLYRALQLLQSSAAGTLSYELALEGGMDSALWAGPRKKHEEARISLMARFSPLADSSDENGSFSYRLTLGLPFQKEAAAFAGESQVKEETLTFRGARPAKPLEGQRRHEANDAAFRLESQVKEETLTFHYAARPVKLLERKGRHVVARDNKGLRVDVGVEPMLSETALGSIIEPEGFPDLDLIRRTMLDWRFYHDLRTDRDSPLRRPSLAVTSPTLASDGSNLAAVFATLIHIREDDSELRKMIADAFPGAHLIVPPPERYASFGMTFPEYPNRIFDASELSDGTLRYLGIAGAMMAYRLPAFIALNEPEASLHPELLDPLARLVVQASKRTQIWLVTHSEQLAASLRKHGGIKPFSVVKRNGETWIEGLKIVGSFEDD